MNPEYLGTYVLYADFYAKKVQDKELFRMLLQHVLDTPSEVLQAAGPRTECREGQGSTPDEHDRPLCRVSSVAPFEQFDDAWSFQ